MEVANIESKLWDSHTLQIKVLSEVSTQNYSGANVIYFCNW